MGTSWSSLQPRRRRHFILQSSKSFRDLRRCRRHRRSRRLPVNSNCRNPDLNVADLQALSASVSRRINGFRVKKDWELVLLVVVREMSLLFYPGYLVHGRSPVVPTALGQSDMHCLGASPLFLQGLPRFR